MNQICVLRRRPGKFEWNNNRKDVNIKYHKTKEGASWGGGEEGTFYSMLESRVRRQMVTVNFPEHSTTISIHRYIIVARLKC